MTECFGPLRNPYIKAHQGVGQKTSLRREPGTMAPALSRVSVKHGPIMARGIRTLGFLKVDLVKGGEVS